LSELPLSDKRPSQKQYRIFITGAAGLVGLHLVRLLGNSGHKLVAMVRPTSNTQGIFDFIRNNRVDIEVVTAYLHETEKVAQLMHGCDVVVHTAAVIDPHGDPAQLRQTNVDGTASVLKAAIDAQLKQFIHISSLSVIMGDNDCFGVTEDEPLRYSQEAYANSKIDAEKLILSEQMQEKIKVTALRPGFIYGPNEKTWLRKLIFNVRAHTAMLVDDGSKATNLIYVENLCRAIELSIMNPVAFGQIYNLTDGELVTKRQLFDVICAGLNMPPVRLAIPLAFARFMVELSSAIASIAPPRLKNRLALFSWPALRLVGLNQGFDISKAERELGYTDRIPFADGMAKTLISFAGEKKNFVTTKKSARAAARSWVS
jgi:nucleoside-diphosphate-sugar epimerase